MHIDWCCPRVHIETQGWSYHHGKGLVCTDIERGGFECRPEVLVQCTPVLRSRDGERDWASWWQLACRASTRTLLH